MRHITKLLLLNFCLWSFHFSTAQKFTISGYVSDAKTGERLIGVNVYDATTFKGTITNSYGFYSLTLDGGTIKLTFSMVGFTPWQKDINLAGNLTLNVELEPAIELAEVTVVERLVESSVTRNQMGEVTIPIKIVQNLPALLGEIDVIKSVQLLPGVQSGSEGMSGMYVRGGGPDQNLILLDGVPVYNVNHLFGFFSVFNPDAIQNFKLIKGGFPARYGGRLSSVLDITMKEGNNKKVKGAASIGLIASKITIDGPIGENTTYIISGRRTYLDVLTFPFIKLAQAQEGVDELMAGYFFHDLNAKINHKISDKHRIFLSLYTGKDKFYSRMKQDYTSTTVDEYGHLHQETNTFQEKVELWWGNITTALRWNYLINNKLFSNTTVTYSRYKMLIGNFMKDRNSSFDMSYQSGIYDLGTKVDFDYYPNPRHNIKTGVSHTYHTYNPGVLAIFVKETSGNNNQAEFRAGNNQLYSNEISVYAEDDIDVGFGFKVNPGLHWSGFYTHEKFYHSLQPRISAMYLVTEKLSVKAAYAQMYQYINLLTNSNIGLPTDLWVPVTTRIKPNNSHQISFGAGYEINRDLEVTAETFYKTMDNIIEYKEGASYFSLNNDWQEKIATGIGWSYGIELLLMKKYGNITGWIGYTWSKSMRQFNRPGEVISFGKEFPYKFDRRHDISIVVTHKFGDNFDIGVTWVYGTGNPTTLDLQQYPSLDQVLNGSNGTPDIPYYENRNNYRMPPYHRLDVGMNFHKQKEHGRRTWNVAVYNAYNRKNPFYLSYGYDNHGNEKLYSFSLFPLIPSVSWRYEF